MLKSVCNFSNSISKEKMRKKSKGIFHEGQKPVQGQAGMDETIVGVRRNNDNWQAREYDYGQYSVTWSLLLQVLYREI